MELVGFELARWKGSHAILTHPDGRTLSVPERRQLRIGTQRALIRAAGLSRDEFIRLNAEI
ncbi:MAG: type II toxin-antitoxin system HicA family toxin [Chloroflexota bacterium]|nr:type II toxin-antitoxin system HicA family toxin [Chloroflexota bacterium]